MRASDPALQTWKLQLAPLLWRWLVAGVRVGPRAAPGPRHGGAVILACLHRDLIPALLWTRPLQPVLLVSHSADGEILIRTLAPHGFGFVRGSTSRGGGRALVGLLGALRSGRHVGVAVDGPRGPFGQVQEGVLQLSRLSGCPIVPLRVRLGRHWRLRTWDRTVVPWAGTRVTVTEGAPLQVPPDLDAKALALWGARVAAALAQEEA